MKSTRFSRPKGHFGTALTFSMPYGLLAAGVAAGLASSAAGRACCCCGAGPRGWRWAPWWAAWWLHEPRLLRSALLYPLRDLLGFCYWVASYVSNQVRWRGEVYNLLAGWVHAK